MRCNELRLVVQALQRPRLEPYSDLLAIWIVPCNWPERIYV